MKKTIIILGLALVAFTDVAVANTVSTFSISKEIVNYNNTPLCNAIVKGDIATVIKFVKIV